MTGHPFFADARTGLARAALVGAVAAFTLSQPAQGVTAVANETAPRTAAAAPHVFELRGCSVAQVDAIPAIPPAGSYTVYAYADDLLETYAALCTPGS